MCLLYMWHQAVYCRACVVLKDPLQGDCIKPSTLNPRTQGSGLSHRQCLKPGCPLVRRTNLQAALQRLK